CHGSGFAAVSAAEVYQNCRVLVRDDLGSGFIGDGPHRQQHCVGNVPAVVFLLLPHIQDQYILGVHHLFGFLLTDVCIAAIFGSSGCAAPGQQGNKDKKQRDKSFHRQTSCASFSAKARWPCSVKCTPS